VCALGAGASMHRVESAWPSCGLPAYDSLRVVPCLFPQGGTKAGRRNTVGLNEVFQRGSTSGASTGTSFKEFEEKDVLMVFLERTLKFLLVSSCQRQQRRGPHSRHFPRPLP